MRQRRSQIEADFWEVIGDQEKHTGLRSSSIGFQNLRKKKKKKTPFRKSTTALAFKSECLILMTCNRETTSYFLGKDEFIQNDQRIAIWDLQPWQARCGGKGEGFYREEKKVAGGRVKK